METNGLIIILGILVIAQMGLVAGTIVWLSKRIRFDKDGNVLLKKDVYIFSKDFTD